MRPWRCSWIRQQLRAIHKFVYSSRTSCYSEFRSLEDEVIVAGNKVIMADTTCQSNRENWHFRDIFRILQSIERSQVCQCAQVNAKAIRKVSSARLSDELGGGCEYLRSAKLADTKQWSWSCFRFVCTILFRRKLQTETANTSPQRHQILRTYITQIILCRWKVAWDNRLGTKKYIQNYIVVAIKKWNYYIVIQV